jgi:protein required for attachment to host cells
MKPVKTWIVVADAAKTRIYLNEGPGRGLTEMPGKQRDTDLKESREINSDKPGRTFDSGGQGRHAMEPPTDPKRHEKAEIAKDLIDMLSDAHKKRAFDRLILIAPPTMLGDLRGAMPKELESAIHGELPKDLTHANKRELEQHVAAMLAV